MAFSGEFWEMFNPLMPVFNPLMPAGLFKYVRPFCYHQALQGQEHFFIQHVWWLPLNTVTMIL